MSEQKKTYISLFSSAGVGCYGFKLEGFECIATNELIERRLNVQKANNKCKYPSGYICGDITTDATKELLYAEIDRWKRDEQIKSVDVVIATPPCQGMSVANHKKSDTEIVRNSLVVESIKIIKAIRPRFFVFENVPAFMKTVCSDIDGYDKPIADAIEYNLGAEYSYTYRIINFKNYGACSSRTRTVVIGVSKDYADAFFYFVQHLNSLLHVRMITESDSHGIVDHHERRRGHQDLRTGHGDNGSSRCSNTVDLDRNVAFVVHEHGIDLAGSNTVTTGAVDPDDDVAVSGKELLPEHGGSNLVIKPAFLGDRAVELKYPFFGYFAVRLILPCPKLPRLGLHQDCFPPLL